MEIHSYTSLYMCVKNTNVLVLHTLLHQYSKFPGMTKKIKLLKPLIEYDKDHNHTKLSDIVIANTDYDYNLWNWIPE